MYVFEAVTIAVAVIAAAVALVTYLRGPGALEQLGRHGQSWFERSSDREVADRPNEDDRDAPLPRRRLRGRPQ